MQTNINEDENYDENENNLYNVQISRRFDDLESNQNFDDEKSHRKVYIKETPKPDENEKNKKINITKKTNKITQNKNDNLKNINYNKNYDENYDENENNLYDVQLSRNFDDGKSQQKTYIKETSKSEESDDEYIDENVKIRIEDLKINLNKDNNFDNKNYDYGNFQQNNPYVENEERYEDFMPNKSYAKERNKITSRISGNQNYQNPPMKNKNIEYSVSNFSEYEDAGRFDEDGNFVQGPNANRTKKNEKPNIKYDLKEQNKSSEENNLWDRNFFVLCNIFPVIGGDAAHVFASPIKIQWDFDGKTKRLFGYSGNFNFSSDVNFKNERRNKLSEFQESLKDLKEQVSKLVDLIHITKSPVNKHSQRVKIQYFRSLPNAPLEEQILAEEGELGGLICEKLHFLGTQFVDYVNQMEKHLKSAQVLVDDLLVTNKSTRLRNNKGKVYGVTNNGDGSANSANTCLKAVEKDCDNFGKLLETNVKELDDLFVKFKKQENNGASADLQEIIKQMYNGFIESKMKYNELFNQIHNIFMSILNALRSNIVEERFKKDLGEYDKMGLNDGGDLAKAKAKAGVFEADYFQIPMEESSYSGLKETFQKIVDQHWDIKAELAAAYLNIPYPFIATSSKSEQNVVAMGLEYAENRDKAINKRYLTLRALNKAYNACDNFYKTDLKDFEENLISVLGELGEALDSSREVMSENVKEKLAKLQQIADAVQRIWITLENNLKDIDNAYVKTLPRQDVLHQSSIDSIYTLHSLVYIQCKNIKSYVSRISSLIKEYYDSIGKNKDNKSKKIKNNENNKNMKNLEDDEDYKSYDNDNYEEEMRSFRPKFDVSNKNDNNDNYEERKSILQSKYNLGNENDDYYDNDDNYESENMLKHTSNFNTNYEYGRKRDVKKIETPGNQDYMDDNDNNDD